MTDLRKKIASEIMKSEWKMLVMHHRRSALFMVRESVDLLDAAVAIAEDDQGSVKAWIEAADLVRPTEQEVKDWEHEEGFRFRAVIVQPFVLAKLVT